MCIGNVNFEQEMGQPDYKSCRMTTESIRVMDDNCSFEKAFSEKNLKREFLKARDVQFVDNSAGRFLKALLLFGFLTLQGSQPALAGLDITSRLQSIPYLSDLGDISTGFASVRKISLNFYKLAILFASIVVLDILICF